MTELNALVFILKKFRLTDFQESAHVECSECDWLHDAFSESVAELARHCIIHWLTSHQKV